MKMYRFIKAIHNFNLSNGKEQFSTKNAENQIYKTRYQDSQGQFSFIDRYLSETDFIRMTESYPSKTSYSKSSFSVILVQENIFRF